MSTELVDTNGVQIEENDVVCITHYFRPYFGKVQKITPTGRIKVTFIQDGVLRTRYKDYWHTMVIVKNCQKSVDTLKEVCNS